jgi:hypothetical protein
MVKRLFLIIAMLLLLATSGYCANYNPWGYGDVDPLLRRELPYDLVYNGVGRGGVSTIVTDCVSLVPSMSVAFVYVTTKTLTIANGSPGQVLALIAPTSTGVYTPGTLVITATTKTGWNTATMDAAYDMLTLLYIDDSTGWVVIGASSITIA